MSDQDDELLTLKQQHGNHAKKISEIQEELDKTIISLHNEKMKCANLEKEITENEKAVRLRINEVVNDKNALEEVLSRTKSDFQIEKKMLESTLSDLKEQLAKSTRTIDELVQLQQYSIVLVN